MDVVEDDDHEDGPEGIDLVEEDEDLPGDDDGEGDGAPEADEEEEPLGLERSSVNGWRSARLARKSRVSYLGMC